MQTISLSKTEQTLVSVISAWVDEQQQILTRIANERLASILEDHELLGKKCNFARQEDGSWILQVSEETDATQEG